MKIAKYLRLNDKHLLTKKVEQVFELMNTLGLSFEFNDHYLNIKDTTQSKFSEFYMKDIESDDAFMEVLPPIFEYKITVDNPQYKEELVKQKEERAKQQAIDALKREEELKIKAEQQAKQKLEDDKKLLQYKKEELESCARDISRLESEIKKNERF